MEGEHADEEQMAANTAEVAAATAGADTKINLEEEELDEMKDEPPMGDDSEEEKKKAKCRELNAALKDASGRGEWREIGMIEDRMKEVGCEIVSEEDLNESFLPKGRDIRSAARETLMG